MSDREPDCKCRYCTEIGYFRSPKTTNEKRRAGRRGYDTNGVKIRAKRNMTNLPDCWDDIVVRSRRNWKDRGKYRHQWEKKFNPPISCKWRKDY